MDELVRPEAPITDYVTRYSGITAAMMAGVTTSLADVQVALERDRTSTRHLSQTFLSSSHIPQLLSACSSSP